MYSITDDGRKSLRHRGIEPRPFAWKAKILTIRPMALRKLFARRMYGHSFLVAFRFIYCFILVCTGRGKKVAMHQPGIEPGAPRWQREILPLNHWCLHQLFFGAEVYDYEIYTPIASGGKQNLPDRELNPGHPRDRRIY